MIGGKTVLVTGPIAASAGRWWTEPWPAGPAGCTPAPASRWPTRTVCSNVVPS